MDRSPLDHGCRWAGRGSLSAQETAPRPQIGGESTDLSPSLISSDGGWRGTRRRSEGAEAEAEAAAMAVMEKLKIFVVKEPVVAASCLIAGFGTRSSFPSANPTRCARALGA